MGTLINPHAQTVQATQDFTAEPVYLRNPQTGVIFKLFHIDTIKRCQQENYLPSSEGAMREQAQEMYEVQGRAWPPRPAEPEKAAAALATLATVEGDEFDTSATLHERNRRAALRSSR